MMRAGEERQLAEMQKALRRVRSSGELLTKEEGLLLIELFGLKWDRNLILQLKIATDPMRYDSSNSKACRERFVRRLTSQIERKLRKIRTRSRKQGIDPSIGLPFGRCTLSGRPLWIDLSSPNLGTIVIVGPTGSGKTNIGRIWMKQLLDLGLKVLFHDCKDEAGPLVNTFGALLVEAGMLPKNFLEPIGDSHAHFMKRVDGVSQIMQMHRGTSALLLEILIQIKEGLAGGKPYPSFEDIMRVAFREARVQGRAQYNTVANALMSFCKMLGFASGVRVGCDEFEESDLVCFRYGQMPVNAMNVLMGWQIDSLMAEATKRGHSNLPRKVIFFDEARAIFGKEVVGAYLGRRIPFQVELLTKGRSYGLRNVILTQSWSSLASDVTENFGVIVVLRQNSFGAAKSLAEAMGGGKALAYEIMDLSIGEAFMKIQGDSGIHKARIPYLDCGDYPSQDQVEALNGPKLSNLCNRCLLAPIQAQMIKPLYLDEDEAVEKTKEGSTKDIDPIRSTHLTHEWIVMLDAIGDEVTGVATLYDELGWSYSLGNRVKKELEENGIIDVEPVVSRTGGRPMLKLTISEKGKRFLDTYEGEKTGK